MDKKFRIFSRLMEYRGVFAISFICIAIMLSNANIAHAYIHLGHTSEPSTAAPAAATGLLVSGAKCVAGTTITAALGTSVGVVFLGLIGALIGGLSGAAGGAMLSCSS